MEKDNEAKGPGNSLDFGARIYDSRLGRWLSIDAYEKFYPPISPFVISLNNPIYHMDCDGNIVVGADGKEVTYTKDANGGIVWSPNATADIIEVGNAMLTTKYGEEAFNKWQNSKTVVRIIIDKNAEPTGDYAETILTKDENGNRIMNEDGQYAEIEVVFNKNKILNPTKRFKDAGYEEVLGAVGTHEVYHNDPEQIKLDESEEYNSEQHQPANQNKPINAEINFREEYRNKNNIKDNSWKEKYKDLNKDNYKGLDKNDQPKKH